MQGGPHRADRQKKAFHRQQSLLCPSEPSLLCRPEHTTLAGMIVTQYGRPLGGLQAGHFEEQGAGLSGHVSSALEQLRGFYGLGDPGSPAASTASQSTGVTTSAAVQECGAGSSRHGAEELVPPMPCSTQAGLLSSASPTSMKRVWSTVLRCFQGSLPCLPQSPKQMSGCHALSGVSAAAHSL